MWLNSNATRGNSALPLTRATDSGRLLGSLADGFGIRSIGFAARIVAEVHGFPSDRFAPLRTDLILQSNTPACEFKPNQAPVQSGIREWM